ncbi:MAG: hypothetical protein EBR86_00290 [Planctomycetia bacterium]|nr:hypothetical protein [Planctomycetia bacterium]
MTVVATAGAGSATAASALPPAIATSLFDPSPPVSRVSVAVLSRAGTARSSGDMPPGAPAGDRRGAEAAMPLAPAE